MLRKLRLVAFAAIAGAVVLIACRRDFDSPYMPGSPGYAGDEWTRDSDGNGIADSLDKYAPGCELPPKECLENAQVISSISGMKNSIQASNILLWVGDGAQAPKLVWSPTEASLRGYALSSSDSTKVRVREGMLLPVAVGSAQISVSVPGVDSLFTSFIAKVVSGGIRVESANIQDITMGTGRDTVPVVKWTPADADYKEFSLISDQPQIASVANGQTIHGASAGKANLTLVTADGSRKSNFAVNVIQGPEAIYTSTLTAETLFLVRGGGAEKPVLNWFPANVTDKRYKLVPVDPGVASVTADSQKVLPISSGSTLVLVKALDGSGKATEFTVVVSGEAIEVTGIDAADMNLVQGADPVAPALIWTPANATNRKYSLSSKDPGVAIVSSGLVMPISMGSSLFTVTTEDGGFMDSFIVTVSRPDSAVHVDSVEVAPFSMPMGSSRKPIPVWHPSDAGNQSFSLSSDDSAVVLPEGETLRALKVGSATIRLTTVDGGRTAVFKVNVYGTVIPVTMITAEDLSMTAGQEKTPVVAWTPLDATHPAFTLISQDTSIVAITEDGRVYGKGVGNVSVTIKSADGPTGVFQVVVNASAVRLISMTATNFTMNVGDPPRDAIITFNPAGTTNMAVTLKAPNGSQVISVNAQNKVAALSPGRALLSIVSNENADITAACSVTVVALVKSVSAKDDTLRLGQAEKEVSGLMTWDPPNATNKAFTLKSNDTTIVKPTGNQTYKAMAGGRTTVVVRAADGSEKADTFSVWVKIPLTQISAKDVTLKTTDPAYNTEPLMTFVPTTASDKTWWLTPVNAAASASVVAIQNGWQLKPVGPGTAAIIAISSDNPAAKDTFTVTITQPVISITVADITLKKGGGDKEPVITWNPGTATNKGYTLSGGSAGIATVAGGTKIHPVGSGSVNMTATTADGSKTAVFKVTVVVPVESIKGNNLSMWTNFPDETPSIEVSPSDATDKQYTLTSLDPDVATIVNGKIHAVSGGTARIVVTSHENDQITDTFNVTVAGFGF